MVTKGYNAGGWTDVGGARIRPGLFGYAVLEELWESRDGRREWRRVRGPYTIQPPNKESEADTIVRLLKQAEAR